MPSSGQTWIRWLGYGVLAVLATAVAVELARPFRTASIAFDSQAAVLHFQRIVAGQHLESFVATTPKPLLTVVFGLTHALTDDWRAIAWLTIAAYVAAVVGSAALARTLAGPIAGAFSGIAVLMTASLLFDVGYALATPYSLLLWVIAGFALARTRPLWWVAGLALALASLARLETLVVVGFALLAMGWGSLAPVRFVPGGRPLRAAWAVPVLGLLAIPAMMVHDALLTGDPFFWATVSSRYSELTRLHVMTGAEVIAFLAERYWSMGALVVLAVIGVVRLWRPGQRPIALGLIALGPGIAAFLVLLGLRGVFVSDRYAVAIDLAVAFGAGIGFAWLAVDIGRRLPEFGARWPGLGPIVGPVAAGAIALVVVGPYWVNDPDLRTSVRRSLALHADADEALPTLTANGPPATPGQPWLMVPVPVLPRMAVDLDASLTTDVVSTDAARVDVASGYPPPGTAVFHSRWGDPGTDGFKALEVSEPTRVGDVILEPLLAPGAGGPWVTRIEAGP